MTKGLFRQLPMINELPVRTLNSKSFCHPDLVEGICEYALMLRQAQHDRNFLSLERQVATVKTIEEVVILSLSKDYL